MITNNRGVITALFGVGILGASYLLQRQSSMLSNKKMRNRQRKAKRQSGIDDDILIILRRFKNGQSKGCMHGFHPCESTNLSSSDGINIVYNFLELVMEIICVCERRNDPVGGAYVALRQSMHDRFPSVFQDAATIDLLSRAFLCIATELLLDRRAGTLTRLQIDIKAKNTYRCAAILTYVEYLTQYVEVSLHCSKPFPYHHRIHELICSDERRVVSYTRKRIKCTCLDARFLQVKSHKKMSVCDNHSCSKDNVELKALMRCERCRKAHYCSKQCQAAAYEEEHKRECVGWKKWKKLKQKRTNSKPRDEAVQN